MMRSVRVFEADLAVGDVYSFHTDGVASSFALEQYAVLPACEAATRALNDHGKLIDDATVVIVRYRG